MPFRRILFPYRCPGCDAVRREDGFCGNCLDDIEFATGAVCQKCGKRLMDSREEFCSDCKKTKHSFEEARAVYLYEGPLKMSMYRFKYSNRRGYALHFARDAVALQALWLKKIRPEAVIPVPLYHEKEKKRGYNQAEVFGAALARELRIPIRTDIVDRVKPTAPMKTMTPEERRNNLISAFQCRETSVNLRRVILVDDIYTTGSTVDAITDVLHRVGIQEVYVMCICVGRGN